MKVTDAISGGNVCVGTFGGLLLSVFGNILVADMVKTAILAAVGAVVSFGVSVMLRAFSKRCRNTNRLLS